MPPAAKKRKMKGKCKVVCSYVASMQVSKHIMLKTGFTILKHFIIIICYSTSNLQPSTAIANQLLGKSV